LKDSFVDGLLGVLFLGAFMPRSMFLCVLGGLIFLSFGAVIPFLILMVPVVASIYLLQFWMDDIKQSERDSSPDDPPPAYTGPDDLPRSKQGTRQVPGRWLQAGSD
jgi:hypothetical protein